MKEAWDRLKYRRVVQRLAGPKLLRAFAETHPEAFFVEIGSNDGEKHDHLTPFIRGHHWSGIMIEPVPYVFERLRRNYGDLAPRVQLENAAIADRDGQLPFYHLPHYEQNPGLPEWYDAIGSFSRDSLLRHAQDIPDIETRMIETSVPAITFESLLARHGDPHVDLLLLDTEGYDYEILRNIDLDARRPRLVVYEHYHLDDDRRVQCRAMLEAHGYTTLEEGFDTFCLRTGFDDALSRRWRRLKPGVPGVSIHDDRT